jgi:hypothetical protein
MAKEGLQSSANFQSVRTTVSAHEGRIGILRRLGYASLVFWPATFLAEPHPEEIQQQLVTTLQFSWVVVPFITTRVSKRALREGKIKKTYLVSVVAAVPVSVLLIYFIIAFVLR